MTTATPAKTQKPIATALSAPAGTVTLGPIRVAYPHLLKPRTSNFNGVEKTRFEATILIPKDQPDQVEKAKAAIRAAFVQKFGSEVKLAKDKQPLKDGDASTTDDGDDAGKYPGYFYANVNAFPDNPPQLRHADKSVLTDPGAMKSGDWIYALVKPRAYAFENTKGVAFDILGARMVRKGEPIGSGTVDKGAVCDALDDLDIEVETADDEAF